MTKPPAGSSLLFGALADSGRIKQRKNGGYRMVLKGVDDIDWFTDRPNRMAGEWSPKKLLREWDVLFSDGAPNAQMSCSAMSFMDFAGRVERRVNMSFEMFKPSLNKKRTKLSFDIKSIGKKNSDLLTGLKNKRFSDVSLFIDNGTTGDTSVTMKVWNNSGLLLKIKSDSEDAIFGNPTGVSGYTDATLDDREIYFTGGDDSDEGVLDVPVTLKNGLEYPLVSFYLQYYNPIEGDRIAQCASRYADGNDNDNGPTTVYYSIGGTDTKSVEAVCDGMGSENM